MPPIVTVFPGILTCTAASFVKVSVVKIASAAFRLPLSLKAEMARGIPVWSALSKGGEPIFPVEATAIRRGEIPSSFPVIVAICSAMANPSAPVQAFADPELATIA
jgi:hypothetical protein